MLIIYSKRILFYVQPLCLDSGIACAEWCAQAASRSYRQSSVSPHWPHISIFCQVRYGTWCHAQNTKLMLMLDYCCDWCNHVFFLCLVNSFMSQFCLHFQSSWIKRCECSNFKQYYIGDSIHQHNNRVWKYRKGSGWPTFFVTAFHMTLLSEKKADYFCTGGPLISIDVQGWSATSDRQIWHIYLFFLV